MRIRHIRSIKRIETPITIALVILLTLSSPIIIYTYTWWIATNSQITIEKVSFRLAQDGRYIDIKLKASGSHSIEPATLYLNSSRLPTFTITKQRLENN